MSLQLPGQGEAILPPFPAQSRFEAREVLGQGANGVVYRALDSETGVEVALKTLFSSNVEQIYHLKTEFRSLAEITHPNLVQLDELVVGPESCFFTMELLRGQTLGDFARELAGDTKPREWTDPALARLRSVALQLALGISALHDAGKLHRDIKPTNILVTRDERAVLVDFGLCTELRLVERTRNPFVGTLLYMAPEQAWGKPLSRAADWYALGAVLYETIVGRLPFEAEGARMLFEKEKPPVVPPGSSPAALPLLELAIALMDPLPERRPRVGAILAVLSGADAPARRGGPSDAPFVGRSEECAALEGALRDVVEGRPAVIHVEGASGVGKTELLERYLGSIEPRPGVVILRGRCHARESVGYNGFDGVVDQLSEWLSKLDASELAEVLPSDVGALCAIFPVFGRIAAIMQQTQQKDAFVGEPYVVRQRAFRALRELLTKMSERYTVVVALDDVQSGGLDTASLISEVFRPPHSPRLLLVLSYRTADEGSGATLAVLRQRAKVLFDSIHWVKLEPLGLEDSRELGVQLLGGDVTARAIAERVASESGGHPLFLRELAFAAVSTDAAPSLEGGADLARLLTGRIAQLSETERAIVELAAIASRPLRRRVLLAAAGAGERGRADVARLVQKRLVRETITIGEPTIEPYHAKVREAVLGTWAAPSRRARHRALADALLAEQEPDADLLVDQLRGAGDLTRAAHFALIAADRAHAALAFDREAHLYRVALEIADDPATPAEARTALEPIWRTRVCLAAALVDAGRSRDAAETYASASREAARAGAPEAIDLERRAAEHFLRGGHIDEGTTLLRQVLSGAGVPYPSSGATAVATTIALRTRLSFRGLEFIPRSEDQISVADRARVDACWSAGLGCAWIDTTRAAAFQARYMLLALEAGDPSRVSLALATEASQLAAVGGKRRLERARTTMDRAMATAKQGEGHIAQTFTLLMAGSIEFYASRWRESLALCSSAEAVLREHQNRSEWELMTAHTLALASMAYLGQLRTLRERQLVLLDEARDRGNMLASVCLACGPANIGWLASDEPREARRNADDALAPWKESHQLPRYLHLVASAQIALYENDPRAFELVSTTWSRLMTSMTFYVQNFRVTLRHLRGRCALALLARSASVASGLSRPQLLRLVRGEARKLSNEEVAWAPTLGRLLDAGALAMSGNEVASAAVLESAANELRSLDMMLHAAAADHERGRLIGGDEGRALQRSAEAWMVDERVVDPARLAATLVPGVVRGY